MEAHFQYKLASEKSHYTLGGNLLRTPERLLAKGLAVIQPFTFYLSEDYCAMQSLNAVARSFGITALEKQEAGPHETWNSKQSCHDKADKDAGPGVTRQSCNGAGAKRGSQAC